MQTTGASRVARARPGAPWLRVGARRATTSAEGPGRRYALWLQGCSLRCPGCCNPHLLDGRGGERVSVSRVLREIEAVAAQIEGVTLLGGEPFDQAAALAALGSGVRALGLSLMTFSGFTLEELRARQEDAVDALLEACDVLIDGRYDRAQPESARRWVGSRNQRFHYLSARYSPAIERGGAQAGECTLEVRITPEGRCLVNGWPEPDWAR
jgi:anaerobic ribonucleoside-triphosphate reductase activating protein